MSEVVISFNGRTYRLGAEAGQEKRLGVLADIVRERIAKLSAQFGNVGDERLLLLAAMTLADELLDARAQVAADNTTSAQAAPADAEKDGGQRAAGKVRERPATSAKG